VKKRLVPPESFLKLSEKDQRDALEIVREKTDRPTHLLEKDVWVVWTLGAIFDSPLAANLTFKGGTSLSKAYKVIDRFSEDIDLTYDIRRLIADLIGKDEPLPTNRSQASKWTKAVRDRLPHWIKTNVRPIIEAALTDSQLDAWLEIGGTDEDKLVMSYPALTRGTGYVPPVIVLEFGGRATGEPHQVLSVTCDMDGHIPDVTFPVASPLVMSVARTFWEKATAAHVYCAQARLRGERYARHWHDLAALGRSRYFASIILDRDVAASVGQHKSCFFNEKDSAGTDINYATAVSGHLKIVPEGNALAALAEDYGNMRADEVMLGNALSFEQLMHECSEVETRANEAAAGTRARSETLVR